MAASGRGSGLDFFNGTGSDRLNAFVVPTARPVEHLVVGDFDGDLIADLAFSVTGAPDQAHELAVAFGNAVGPLAAPNPIVRVAGVVQLLALPYDQSTSFDGLSVTYEKAGSAGRDSALAQFANGGDRRFLCGVQLTNFAADGSLVTVPALTLTVGAFTHAGQLDALLFGSTVPAPDYGMWLLPNIESGDGRPENLDWGFDPEFTPLRGGLGNGTAPLEVSVRLTAGDLDHDGLDELLGAAPDTLGERCFVTSARVRSGDAGAEALHMAHGAGVLSPAHSVVRCDFRRASDATEPSAANRLVPALCQSSGRPLACIAPVPTGSRPRRRRTDPPLRAGPRRKSARW